MIKKKSDVANKDYKLNFVLSGNDAEGHQYYAWKRYKMKHICIGYIFIPLQEHEYTSAEFFRGNEDKLNGDDLPVCPKELFRYQHFGKLYNLDDSERISDVAKSNIVLTKDKVLKGQYGGLKQKMMDFCSRMIMLYLDRSHWKSWWKSRF